MPHHWIRISVGTPRRLKPYVDDPIALESELRTLVEECGGTAKDVFFDADCAVAYVLVDAGDGDFDLGCVDRELADPKTYRIDLETAEEKRARTSDGPTWEDPRQQDEAS